MDESTQTKPCSRCKESKPTSEFGINRAARDGLMYYCRACVKKSLASLTPEQREAKRRRNAEYMARRRADPEWALVIAARTREWFRANPDRVKEYRAEFKVRHPEKIAAWRERDREAANERARRWAKENPTKNVEKTARRRARERAATIGPVDVEALWTGACGICLAPMDRALRRPDPLSPSIDHIIPLARGGSHTQANLQWAHLTCNFRKHCSLP